MFEEDKKKVERYLITSGQRKAIIRQDGRYYVATLHTDPGNQYGEPYDYVRVEEFPSPIELVN